MSGAFLRALRAIALLLACASFGFSALASTTYRVDYVGAGSTGPFSVTFPFLAASDLRVVEVVTSSGVETTLTYPGDYSVTGGSNATGSITLTVALPVGTNLMIDRGNLPQIQPVSLPNQGAFNAKTHETEFDRLTMLVQQLQAAVDHTIRIPMTETLSAANLTVGGAATRTNLYLGFDASGHVTLLAGGSGGGGGGSSKVTAVSANYTAIITDKVLLINATGGSWATTLPPASGLGIGTSQELVVKRTDTSANAPTVVAAGSDTIEGGTFTPQPGDCYLLQSDGISKWYITGYYRP